MRKSLEETWRYLESQGEEPPRQPDGRPLIADAMPNFDDEEPRFSYYKYCLEDADHGDLTLPRLFFGRSSFIRVRFAGTDLTESRMCWNDFDGCDFSGADLTGCDMRASVFSGCKFAGAVLRGADLRRSTFKDCDFSGADMTGAIAKDAGSQAGLRSLLSGEQQAAIAWSVDGGPEPPGG